MNEHSLLAVSVATCCFLAACGKGSGEAPPPKQPTTSLSDIRSPVAQQKAAEEARQSSLPHADPATPADQYRKLDSGDQIMYLYYALSNLPPDMEKIGNAISQEYRQTQDGFKKQDILKVLQPRAQDDIERAKKSRYVIWEDRSPPIDKYDFSTKSFPIRQAYWGGDNYFYFNNNGAYHIGFSAADKLRAFPVSDETLARKIEGYFAKYDALRLRIYAFGQDVDMNSNLVKAEVVKFELLDREGHVLAATGP